MTDHEATERLIDLYCSVWNEADPARRAAILEPIWGEDATYTDPRSDLRGAAELLAHIAGIVSAREGAQILRTSVVDTHHRLARFEWQAVDAAGTTLLDGVDFVEIAPDGRIRKVVGFFGRLMAQD
jgi:hypothetical protein